MEAYLSLKSSDYTNALALKGIHELISSLPQAYIDGNSIAARSGMSFVALISGICLANAGLGTVHGFASSVGASFNIPHGVICGTLMAPANEITVRELRKTAGNSISLKKYANLRKVFSGKKDMTDEFYIDCFISRLYELTSELDLPLLGKYGVREEDISEIITATDNKNNPVKLSQDYLAEILIKRL